MAVQLFGADYSVYVRIARMTLLEKGVEHEVTPVDVFAAEGIPDWYRERHPFGRIPAFEHDGFRLFETAAIARYIDEAFPGPALQPADARGRATMGQIVGMLDSYAYRPMVWDVTVERFEAKIPDEARIADGLDKAQTALQALSGIKTPGAFLCGATLSLADLHAAPILAYFAKAREGAAMLQSFPAIADWLAAMETRASFGATQKRD